MSFEGALSTVPLPDLLQLLGSTRKTGCLRVELSPSWVKLFLREGLLVSVSGSDPDGYVSQTLVSLGKVSEGDMGRALMESGRDGKMIGVILVEKGLMSETDVRRYLADKAYDSIARLMGWTEARFRFDEFMLPGEAMIPLDLSVERLLLEGLRRQDELEHLRKQLPASDPVLEWTGESPEVDLASQTLVGTVLRKLQTPQSYSQLRAQLKTSEFALLDGVTRLLKSGILRPGQREPLPSMADGWLDDGRKLLAAGFPGRAAEILRLGLGAAPDNVEARELLVAAEREFVNEISRDKIPYDAVPELVRPAEELADRSLSPPEFFILTRLADAWTVGQIVETTPLPSAETLLAIDRLMRGGYVRLRRTGVPRRQRARS